MSSHPITVHFAVRRAEYRSIFGDMDGPQPPFIAQLRKITPHRQLLLAPWAEAEVFFGIFQISICRPSESPGFEFGQGRMRFWDHRELDGSTVRRSCGL
jgi:hypothetical protein